MRILFIAFLAFISSVISAQKMPTPILLSNGWSISPVGEKLPLGDLPLNIAVSKNKKLIAIYNNGQSDQSIILIDTKTNTRLDSMPIAKSWYGLAFTEDSKSLYASGGNDNVIRHYNIVNNKLVATDTIILGKKWPVKISPTGLAIDDENKMLYVVSKESNSLYSIDLTTKNITTTYLGAEAYTCLLDTKNKQLYISLWGNDKVLFYDIQSARIVDSIDVGDNPNEICLNKNNSILYVANANDNSVSIIQLKTKKVIETLNAALYPNAPSGSTTNGVALSEDDKTLYIANADNNCLAVFDVSKVGESKSKGFIPTGWYPTNVKVVGKKIYVTNGKGFSSLANPDGPNPFGRKQSVTYQQSDNTKPPAVQYIGGLFRGTLSIINEPNPLLLGKYAAMVYANTPYNKEKELHANGEKNNPIPMNVGDTSPIKFVFYVIKENRTYDQVLGDVKEGNGDTSLCLFGEKITPNQHLLAKQFVLLDNFYVDAEVSADGHNWSMGAYATDYLEKTWPTSYGGRGGSYDAEGNRAIANNKAGFIWDYCKKYNKSYRTYGEFADNFKPNIPALKNHYCTYFQGYTNAIRDTVRYYQWQRDFDSLIAINQVPNFNTIRFGNDHTEGIRLNRPTPYAHVADNDLAVGLFIDHLSKSSIWNKSVVFMLEDDAQNGPDHVDAHRSPCYIVGPHVKRNFVDHTMYSTTSVLRTIELILGLPPMTQYDAAANPMWRCFTNKANNTVYDYLPSNIDLNERNKAKNELTVLSEKYNWDKEDAVPDMVFNNLLWKGLKGLHYNVPSPKRAAFIKVIEKKKDDD